MRQEVAALMEMHKSIFTSVIGVCGWSGHCLIIHLRHGTVQGSQGKNRCLELSTCMKTQSNSAVVAVIETLMHLQN